MPRGFNVPCPRVFAPFILQPKRRLTLPVPKPSPPNPTSSPTHSASPSDHGQLSEPRALGTRCHKCVNLGHKPSTMNCRSGRRASRNRHQMVIAPYGVSAPWDASCSTDHQPLRSQMTETAYTLRLALISSKHGATRTSSHIENLDRSG